MKKLLLFLLPLAACTKKPCEPEFTLNGTQWVNVLNSKMVFRFTSDSLFWVNDSVRKSPYKATKNTMTLYSPYDTVSFNISVGDSVMSWVDYPLPKFIIAFRRVK